MWTKLGDEYSDWARVLSDAAFRTHTEALLWSNRRGLDYVISKRDLQRFAETCDPDAAAAELVALGWWQELPAGDWYVGCHFSDWQLEACEVKRRKEANVLRVTRHRRHKTGDHSLCTDRCQE